MGNKPRRKKTERLKDGNGTARRPLIACLAGLLVAVWIAYAPALDNDFVSWDDPTYVTERPEVLNPTAANKAALWRRPVSLNYHPVTMLTLAWNSEQADKDPRTGLPEARPFIRTNIALHALNTLLVLLFLQLLTRGNLAVSAFTTMVFALHPMHVESVAWVSERKDVLYAFFFLGGLLAYVRWVRNGGTMWYALVVVLFLLSCLSKAMAVVFPLVLVLIDVWEKRDLRTLRPWLEKAPLFAISLFFGLMALDVQSGGNFHGLLEVDVARGKEKAVAEAFPFIDRLQYGAYGFVMYLWKFLVPTGLSTFYPYPADGTKSALFPLSLVVMVATLAWAIWSLKRGRWFFFGIGFFFLTVVTVLQFISVGRVIMADRYTYLPYIGVAFLLGGYIDHLLREKTWRERAWIGLIGVTGLTLLPLTRAQIKVWQDTRTLWRRVIDLHPGTPDPYSILGSWYGKRSAREKDLQLLDSAGMVLTEGIRTGAASAPLFEAMGTFHGSKGLPDSAIHYLDRAISFGPATGQLYHNRAMARLNSGQDEATTRAAIDDFGRAIAMGHLAIGDSHASRGFAQLRMGDPKAALADLDIAIDRFGTARAEVFINRGIAHLRLGDPARAAADARTALKIDPNAQLANQLLQQAGG